MSIYHFLIKSNFYFSHSSEKSLILEIYLLKVTQDTLTFFTWNYYDKLRSKKSILCCKKNFRENCSLTPVGEKKFGKFPDQWRCKLMPRVFVGKKIHVGTYIFRDCFSCLWHALHCKDEVKRFFAWQLVSHLSISKVWL